MKDLLSAYKIQAQNLNQVRAPIANAGIISGFWIAQKWRNI